MKYKELAGNELQHSSGPCDEFGRVIESLQFCQIAAGSIKAKSRKYQGVFEAKSRV